MHISVSGKIQHGAGRRLEFWIKTLSPSRGEAKGGLRGLSPPTIEIIPPNTTDGL